MSLAPWKNCADLFIDDGSEKWSSMKRSLSKGLPLLSERACVTQVFNALWASTSTDRSALRPSPSLAQLNWSSILEEGLPQVAIFNMEL